MEENIKYNTWFYFNELTGRWKETEHGHELRKRLSDDIIGIFQHYSDFYIEKKGREEPDSELYIINVTAGADRLRIYSS